MQKKNALALNKGDVYIQGPAFYSPTAAVFRENGYRIVDTMDTADIIVLTGGADINPAIYKEDPIPGTHFNQTRDSVDMYASQTGVGANKFMVGICRGAQLLNCWPNKGTLWQDVDHHAGAGHTVLDHITNKNWRTNSVHHQMMRMAKGGTLVASTSRSTFRRAWKEHEQGPGRDPEVIWYPETKCLLFQGHPEFGHPETTEYFFTLMDRYYLGKKPNGGPIMQDNNRSIPEGCEAKRSISHDSEQAEGDFERSEEEETPASLLADCGGSTASMCPV